MKGAKVVLLKKERGASAVEFAIVLPFLAMLMFGIVEGSLALYDKAMITNASREGARAGIIYSLPPITDREITNVVNNYLSNHLITFGGPPGANVAVTRTGSSPGGQLKVAVTYTYNFLVLPGLVSNLAGGINIGAETVMRME